MGMLRRWMENISPPAEGSLLFVSAYPESIK